MLGREYRLVTTLAEFQAITAGWMGYLAVDTETYGKAWDKPEARRLLGISLSPEKSVNGIKGLYIPFNSFQEGRWKVYDVSPILPYLQTYMDAATGLIGHNYTYDKTWLGLYGISTPKWHADTRIMWHLASAPSGPRPYGLKDAQVELLGWERRGDEELASNVKAKGGKLSNGDHYMADLDLLATYACIDTYSTICVYSLLTGFFNTYTYWPMLHMMMQYGELLELNTQTGIRVDREGLQRAHDRLLKVKEAAKRRVHKELAHDIEELERDWVDRRASYYKRPSNKIRLLNHPEEWKRFNINSDKDKRELFFDRLQFKALERTDSGAPSAGADSIKWNNHPVVEPYLTYEHFNTATSNFSGPYLDASALDGRLHPGFNICGTVSYRLSGFKPYLLNAPFDEKRILRHLRVEEGQIGVHADLSAIEPTITAHYSEDPSLLKVFRDGLGDIYLDLALELFPNDKELQRGYDPNTPISKEVKKKFERQRKIAKQVQLAVQYTGTGHTVSRNLTKNGLPTSVEQANLYVQAYWKKFKAVADFNQSLFDLNRSQGHLRNVIGRIIRVPDPHYKDLPNRFVQSSAHDVLILWVLEIYRLCGAYGVPISPILLDCHDSTTNSTDAVNGPTLMHIYQEALNTVNKQLALCTTIKMESKFFTTLAGLKGDE